MLATENNVFWRGPRLLILTVVFILRMTVTFGEGLPGEIEVLGSSSEAPNNLTYNATLNAFGSKPSDILSLCYKTYSDVYSDAVHPTLFRLSKKVVLKIFQEQAFEDICLPLYRKYGHCNEKSYRYLIFCAENHVVFLHTRKCEKPSEEDKYFEYLWAASLLRKRYGCFEHICNGFYRVIVRNVSNSIVQLFRFTQGGSKEHCGNIYGNKALKDALAGKTKLTSVWTVNKFFPSCYSKFYITWMGIPEEKGLNRFWDYLPYSCQVGEIVLVTFVGFIGVTGALGNLVVVAVMLNRDRRADESSILRMSLAFADLFTCCLVVIPAFFDHLEPILGYIDLDENSFTIDYDEKKSSIAWMQFPLLIKVTDGYRFFQGMILGVCSLVSVFTVFLLSVERLILTGRQVLRYKHYFTVRRVKLAVFLSWIIAIPIILFFMYDSEASFSVTWSWLLKLPIATSRDKPLKVVRGIYSFLIIVLSLICLSTIMTSLVSIYNFVKQQAKMEAEWKRLNMRVSGPFHRENRHIMTTLCILMALFMNATIPMGIFITVIQADVFFPTEDIFKYLAFWLFLAGSSLNPWLYNMRSKQFREEVLGLLRAMIPAYLRVKFEGSKEAVRKRQGDVAEKKMLKHLGLIDE